MHASIYTHARTHSDTRPNKLGTHTHTHTHTAKHTGVVVGSSGGLFLVCEDFWEIVRPFIPRPHFLSSSSSFFFLLLFEVEISSRTLISLFMPESVHSGSASLLVRAPRTRDRKVASSNPAGPGETDRKGR